MDPTMHFILIISRLPNEIYEASSFPSMEDSFIFPVNWILIAPAIDAADG
jgi:hypothetical protein